MNDREKPSVSPALEEAPLSRPEYLNVMVHFYRGEMHRATTWRQRIDATTNWAVLTVAGMLSIAFADPAQSHFVLLLSNLVVCAFLVIEARRYRRYEVYAARVRMLEENLLSPIVSRELISPMSHWRKQICQDLSEPRYKSRMIPTIGFRLRRNYVFIYAILLGAWILKLEMHPDLAGSFEVLWERMRVGTLLPPMAVALGGFLFWAGLLVVIWQGRRLHGQRPADEVEGIEGFPERWKM
jgi:uncharacterized membrane protein